MVFTRCPKAALRDELHKEAEWFQQWSWLKRYGSMPRDGGRDAQDPRFIEAVDLIEAEIEALGEMKRKEPRKG